MEVSHKITFESSHFKSSLIEAQDLLTDPSNFKLQFLFSISNHFFLALSASLPLFGRLSTEVNIRSQTLSLSLSLSHQFPNLNIYKALDFQNINEYILAPVTNLRHD